MILWDNSYVYATDPNKNVRVKRFQDEWMGSGWIEEFFDYKPFGELKNYVQSKPRFMFSSEEYMPETGMYHYLYRAYSPSLARFITRDPIEEAGGVNLYCFVNNNPVSYWDENGCLMSIEEFIGPTLDFKRNLHESLHNMKKPFIDLYNSLTGQPASPPYERVKDHNKYNECINKCLHETFSSEIANSGIIFTTLGAKLIPKKHGAGAFGGSKGTSFLSWLLSKNKLTNKRFSHNVPAPTIRTGLKGRTKRLPSFMGRWSSVIGFALNMSLLYQYNSCLNDCMENPCQ